MSYIKTVQLARKNAVRFGEPFIVFGIKRWFGWEYSCGDVVCFQFYLANEGRPVVRYMMAMPNGRVVQ